MAIVAYVILCLLGMLVSALGGPAVVVAAFLVGMVLLAFRHELRHHTDKLRTTGERGSRTLPVEIPLSRASALNPQPQAVSMAQTRRNTPAQH